MATSGAYGFAATRDQIINAALAKVAAIAEGGTGNSDQINKGAFLLEAVIKGAEADGMPLWAIVEATIPCSTFINGSATIGTAQQVDIPAPLKVLYGFNRDNTGDTPTDIPLTVLTHYDYSWLSSKYSLGTPVQYWYDPGNGIGTLKLWPIPDGPSVENNSIHIIYQRPFQDAGIGTNNIDFPSYWTLALIYKLAWILAPDYGVPPNDRAVLAKEALNFWTEALSFGTEEGSLYLEPDWTRMYMGQGYHGG